ACAGDAQVTIPEGLRAEEIRARIIDQTDLAEADVTKAFAATSSIGLPPYADGDLEGYLFPATYAVSRETTATGLLRHMVDAFTAKADSLNLEARAKQLGVSPHDVVVVASLVQAEARRSEDMPKVASVIYNRLKVDMPLQFDSALHYAVDSRGEVATSDSLRDIDSPYNTYRHTGLVPTAIDSPGEQAIEAALNPADTTYLYFVTVNLRTGETRFATSFAEHERNVARYDAYCETSDAC
nr:endolytic transglycosylase MltG [Propionibacteriales bacterium]